MGTRFVPPPGDPPRHRRRRTLARAALALGVVVAAFGLSAWEAARLQRELDQARREIDRKEWGVALPRLKSLAGWRSGWARDEVHYLIGLCHWRKGSRREAVEAFHRIASGSRFEALAAPFQAEDLVLRWRFREAEDLLWRIQGSAFHEAGAAWPALVKLGRMEARFDEVRLWLRRAIAETENPVSLLRDLWLLDRGVAPMEGLRANLERARSSNPDDDRVWLGLGRVAILEGRLDEAASWLERCRSRSPGDPAVKRAALDLARARGDARDAARRLDVALWPELDPDEKWSWNRWIARALGSSQEERRVLRRLLDFEPHDPEALERLGTLEAQAGNLAEANQLKQRKGDVDQALDRYRTRITGRASFATSEERMAMAGLAAQAGRAFDARAWRLLAARLDPSAARLTAAAARLELRGADVARDFAEFAAKDSEAASSGVAGTRAGSEGAATAIAFRDDARTAGLDFRFLTGETAIHQLPETMGGGLGLLDYDNDGWLDLYCAQGGAFPPAAPPATGGDRLFRNRGDGTFEDATATSGIAAFPQGYGHGVAVGDYDNDGWADLFVTRWRGYALYRNRGDGTFQDATRSAGLDGDRDWPTSAAFADLDGDGDLDLYVCHYLRWNAADPRLCRDPQSQSYVTCNPRDFPALSDHVFRNDGGRFLDVSAEAGIDDQEGRGLGVVAADLDGDNRVDLFVSNDQSANFLFHNLGGFRFQEVAHQWGAAANAAGGYQAGMGVALGDLDGDGRPDLAVTNFYGESTTLYRNLGGLFCDQTAASGLAAASRFLLGFGASFLDADNDGQLDLMTANGHLDQLPGTPYEMPVQLLLGREGRLKELKGIAALMVPRIGRALAVGDLDNDGRLDAVILDHKGPLVYLHNQSARAGHFLSLRLVGRTGVREAIGASVSVVAGGKRQTRWRSSGGSYQSASDGRLHFGLGETARIERIEVRWPSGKVQSLPGPAADRGYLLREGEDRLEPAPYSSR